MEWTKEKRSNNKLSILDGEWRFEKNQQKRKKTELSESISLQLLCTWSTLLGPFEIFCYLVWIEKSVGVQIAPLGWLHWILIRLVVTQFPATILS